MQICLELFLMLAIQTTGSREQAPCGGESGAAAVQRSLCLMTGSAMLAQLVQEGSSSS